MISIARGGAKLWLIIVVIVVLSPLLIIAIPAIIAVWAMGKFGLVKRIDNVLHLSHNRSSSQVAEIE